MVVLKAKAYAMADEVSQEIEHTFSKVPKHVAIIMDGNGRWAAARKLSRLQGHHQGVEALRRTLESARDFGIQYLTVWAFSTENWRRPLSEVKSLMNLLRHYIKKDLKEIHNNKINLRFIGRRDNLPADIVKLMNHAEELTKNNTSFYLIVAFNYGGRDDIVKSVKIISQKVRDNLLQAEDITEDLVGSYLSTAMIPDPDMMIRTSGESRISNFLLWQLSYAELIFTQTYWPDFTKEDLALAIYEYQRRERRYGAVNS